MKVADLRSRITIQAKSKTEDGIGGYTTSWTTRENVWANITPGTSRERNIADRIAPNTSHVITIRYVEGITTLMRVSFGTRIFAINGLVTDQEGKT